MPNVLVFIEQRDGQIKRASLESLSKGAELAQGGKVIAVLIGSNIQSLAEGLGKYGATKVAVFESESLARYAPTAFAKLIVKVVKEESATLVLLAGTAMGKDLAPRVGARLGAGVVSDAIDLTDEGGKLVAKRFAYSGKAVASVALESDVKVFSIRPNSFPINDAHSAVAEVVLSNYNPEAAELRDVVKEIVAAVGKLDVAEADIVVSGGRGLRDPNADGKQNWENLERLAQTIGGAVGASRAVVDAHWRPHSEQVGQTGKVVSPKLYIACGISGAVQHLAGMTASKVIVAINKDKDAPIFQVADYGIVGTVEDVLPQLIEAFKNVVSHN